MPVVRLTNATFESGVNVARMAYPNETGGIVVGWWTSDEDVYAACLLPVIDANATRDSYVLSAPAAQAELTSYQELTGDERIGYVGEWHSHPGRPHPSYVDRAALIAITRKTGQPSVGIVVGTDTAGNPDVRAMLGQVSRNPFKKVRRAHIERITQ